MMSTWLNKMIIFLLATLMGSSGLSITIREETLVWELLRVSLVSFVLLLLPTGKLPSSVKFPMAGSTCVGIKRDEMHLFGFHLRKRKHSSHSSLVQLVSF